MDNRRILHGRTAYSTAGKRHLQGCYADIDALRSRLGSARERPAGNSAGVRLVGVRNDALTDSIFQRFKDYGSAAYIGEPVSVADHMLQTARAAEEDGVPDSLIASALLHDYGHLLHDLPEDVAEQGVDTCHEELAFDFLSRYFEDEVVVPIRLHVAAKRYLCAVEPTYLAALSPASRLSLELQGGPFTHDEAEKFMRSHHAEHAIRLRRYDDVAKSVGAATQNLEHYRPILLSVCLP